MKTLLASAIILLSLCATIPCSAQYGQNNSKLNDNVYLERNNPLAQTIFTVDTSINHMDFGEKKNNRPFVTIFALKQVDLNQPHFTFTKNQIKRTNMSKNSGIKSIELTINGFEVTYNPKGRTGVVDDYVVVHTENGALVLWLTGTLIKAAKGDDTSAAKTAETKDEKAAAAAEKAP